MNPAAFFPWALVAWLFGKTAQAAARPAVVRPRQRPTVRPRRPTATTPAAKPAAKPAVKVPTVIKTPTGTVPAVYKPTPEPWPQAVPAGLPPFPGSQWVPDDPPGAGVVARASQLIPVLWSRGAGTYKCEQTAGRWICYRATPMGTKKGVVAFKLKTESVTTAPVVPVVKLPSSVVPAVAKPKPTPARPAPAPAVSLRTIRLTSPRTEGEDVKTIQRHLGLTADGVYGSGTYAAVKSFQRSKGLVPDGIVGRKTWAALFGTGRAAA